MSIFFKESTPQAYLKSNPRQTVSLGDDPKKWLEELKSELGNHLDLKEVVLVDVPLGDAAEQLIEQAANSLSAEKKELFKSIFEALGYAEAAEMAAEVAGGKAVSSVVKNYTKEIAGIQAGKEFFESADEFQQTIEDRTPAGRSRLLRGAKFVVKRGDTLLHELPLPISAAKVVTSSASDEEEEEDEGIVSSSDSTVEMTDENGKRIRACLFFEQESGKLICVSEAEANEAHRKWGIPEDRFGYYKYSTRGSAKFPSSKLKGEIGRWHASKKK